MKINELKSKVPKRNAVKYAQDGGCYSQFTVVIAFCSIEREKREKRETETERQRCIYRDVNIICKYRHVNIDISIDIDISIYNTILVELPTMITAMTAHINSR